MTEWTKSSGLGLIRKALEKAVADVEVEMRTQFKKEYRAEADRLFDRMKTEAANLENTGRFHRGYGRSGDWTTRLTEFLAFDREAIKDKQKRYYAISHSPSTWEELRDYMPYFKVTYVVADQSATRAFEGARESFIEKNLQKFQSVMGHRNDITAVEVNFHYTRGVFAGALKVVLDNAIVYGYVSLKYVFRTIPNLTPYFQYPLIFGVEAGGKKYSSISEEELRALLGAGPTKTEEQIRQEKGLCPMSGKPAPEGFKARYSSNYLRCPVCGDTVSIQHYKFRQHKSKETVKAAAQAKLVASGNCLMSKQPVPYPLIEKLVKSYTAWPAGKETTQYTVDLWAPGGKARSFPCDGCGKLVTIGDHRDALRPEDVKVFYRTHKK